MKEKIIIIIAIVIALSLFILFYFSKGNKYTVNDIAKYLEQYNNEFSIKDIREQKIYLENINNNPLALFECSPKNNTSIKFYIYETYSNPGLPFGKNILADTYNEEVNKYLKDKYLKKIVIENAGCIDNAIMEIDTIREQIYFEKNNNFGIKNDYLYTICLTIYYYNNINEEIVCFNYGEKTSDVLIRKLNIQKRS